MLWEGRVGEEDEGAWEVRIWEGSEVRVVGREGRVIKG